MTGAIVRRDLHRWTRPELEHQVHTADDQRAAVLAIHRACHTDATPPWKCEHGHYDEACETGIPDRPAVCVACTDSYEEHLPWPCPTALALDAQPPTTTSQEQQ